MLEKQGKMSEITDYSKIRDILEEQRDDLAQSKKPIVWIHIPYEYNTRNWQSFGSRSNYDLNQPYLYVTIQTIINKCADKFRICIIDDTTFPKLIPDWKIDMNLISNPISDKMRALGMVKLLYIYGGVNIPVSFLCMKDLELLYTKGTQDDKPFVCENIDRNMTSSSFSFYPSIDFMGAPRKNQTIMELMDFMQRTISSDFTAASVFVGDFDRWIEGRIRNQRINVISGSEIGVKDINGEPVTVEQLMGNTPIKFSPNMLGIWIPAKDLLKRRKFEYFTRMSISQVLKANIILSKYIIMVNVVDENGAIITELKANPGWVSFWSVPSEAPVWGLKPDYLGNNVLKLKHPSYAGN
tara:strand:+ start:17975 stop:19036 length:1062 start_codon:yes stop_codon:yes gene_type:complete